MVWIVILRFVSLKDMNTRNSPNNQRYNNDHDNHRDGDDEHHNHPPVHIFYKEK